MPRAKTQTSQEAAKKRLEKRVKKLCEKNPDLVAEVLLESSFWPEKVDVGGSYGRRDDDTREGLIGVCFSRDADTWLEVVSKPDPHELNFSHRFRHDLGGGDSPRVRTALLLLALAIKLDNLGDPSNARNIVNESEAGDG